MVIERIRELERKRQEEARRAELERQEKEKQKLLAEDKIKQQTLQRGQVRQQREQEKALRRAGERREKTMKLMKESGVQDEVRKIGKEFLGGFGGIKHDVLIDVDSGIIQLVWGKYRKKKGEVDYTFWDGVLDYSYISAEFDITANSVSINGKKTIAQTEWNSNRNLLVDALAKAYLDPLHRKSKDSDHWIRKPRTSSSSSETPSSSECCCT